MLPMSVNIAMTPEIALWASGLVACALDERPSEGHAPKSSRFWREPRLLQVEEDYLRGRARATPSARPPRG